MPPVSNLKDYADYDWENNDYYHDFPDYEQAKIDDKKAQMRNIKILSVLTILVIMRVLYIVCPCFSMVFNCVKMVLLRVSLLHYIAIPFRYFWATIRAKMKGWDATYYLMVKECKKKGTKPPEYQDYLDYKKSVPAEGRKITNLLVFGQ